MDKHPLLPSWVKAVSRAAQNGTNPGCPCHHWLANAASLAAHPPAVPLPGNIAQLHRLQLLALEAPGGTQMKMPGYQ